MTYNAATDAATHETDSDADGVTGEADISAVASNGAAQADAATAAADHAAQAREFLDRSRIYFEDGMLHQASEKGWGAAAHMAKAVAVTQGWQYTTHAELGGILHNSRKALDDDRLSALRSTPYELHSNFYQRKRHLNAEVIGENLERVAELVDLLEPLAKPTPS